MSGSIVDALIYLFLGYTFFIGLKKGLFNILVDIFGIYGAFFIAWVFQYDVMVFLNKALDINQDLNKTLVFLGLWVVAYLIIYILGKFITSLFKLTGINFVLRLSGGVLNCVKGVIILTVVLTFLTSISSTIYDETKTTILFTGIGSKVMRLYNDKLDENIIQPVSNTMDQSIDSSILDDDFNYNLLER